LKSKQLNDIKKAVKLFVDEFNIIPPVVNIKKVSRGCSGSRAITLPEWIFVDKWCRENIKKANKVLKELNMETIKATPQQYREFYIAHELTHYYLQSLSHQKPFYTILKNLGYDIRFDIFYMKRFVLEELKNDYKR